MMSPRDRILKELSVLCLDERTQKNPAVAYHLRHLHYYFSVEELARVHTGHVSVSIRALEASAADGTEWTRRAVLTAKRALLLTRLARLQSGVQLPASFADDLLTLWDEIERECAALGECSGIALSPELRMRLDTLGKLPSPREQTYNKYVYRVTPDEAIIGDIFSRLERLGLEYYSLVSSADRCVEDFTDGELARIAAQAAAHRIRAASVVSSNGPWHRLERALSVADSLDAEYLEITAPSRDELDSVAAAADRLRRLQHSARMRGRRLLLRFAAGTFADTAESGLALLDAAAENAPDLALSLSDCEIANGTFARLKGRIRMFLADSPSERQEELLAALMHGGYYADRTSLSYVVLPPNIDKASSPFGYTGELAETARQIKERDGSLLQALLTCRALPPLRKKDEMLALLLREEYGELPPAPERISWRCKQDRLPAALTDKARIDRIELTCRLDGKDFTFPIYSTLPLSPGKHPLLVFPNFAADIPHKYFPVEELVDRGYAILSFDFREVSSDDDDPSSGLAKVLGVDRKRTPSSPGKLAMWAWAAQRVMDYAETQTCLDLTHAAVCGHSRLGKAALLAAATDERFRFVFSNDAGCCGDALSRGSKGETVGRIWRYLSFFFCPGFERYVGDPSALPFDQHWLIASIAPRYVYVASADGDLWADPLSQLLSLVAASPAYEKSGGSGLVCEDRFPRTGDVFHEGRIGYHLRKGGHFLSREDWEHFLDFMEKKIASEQPR